MEVKAYRELMKIEEIRELTPLFGDYDLIAKVEAKNFTILSKIIVDRIRKVPGVVETKTLPGMKI
ncbi:MAG: Lrp/AsnC ligand binding domain-containing protein [Candidatus Thermoplasmatota archaeon]|nr:Lrp/AsnC ligand binding domain-containing protein [Candidatus Thermoplasmatota archaeon]